MAITEYPKDLWYLTVSGLQLTPRFTKDCSRLNGHRGLVM
jgi:hypothetical protein